MVVFGGLGNMGNGTADGAGETQGRKRRGRPRKAPVVVQDATQPGAEGIPGDPKVVGKTVRLRPEDWAVIKKISEASSLDESTVTRLLIQQGIRKLKEEIAAGNHWFSTLIPDISAGLDI